MRLQTTATSTPSMAWSIIERSIEAREAVSEWALGAHHGIHAHQDHRGARCRMWSVVARWWVRAIERHSSMMVHVCAPGAAECGI